MERIVVLDKYFKLSDIEFVELAAENRSYLNRIVKQRINFAGVGGLLCGVLIGLGLAGSLVM